MFSLIIVPRWRMALAACLWVCSTGAAMAAPLTLTLGQAQQHAIDRSRQLAAQGHSVAAAYDMAVAAAQLPDPVLKAGIDNLPVGGPDRFRLGADFMTMRRIGIMQELTSGEKLRWRVLRFERLADRSRAAAALATAAIQRDTAIAWLDRYFLERMEDVLAEQIVQARDEVAAAQAAFRGGRVAPASLLEARGTLLVLEDRATELKAQTRAASIALERWTGIPDEVALAGAPDTGVLPIVPGGLEGTLAEHPKIAVLARQVDVAQAEAGLARANRKSDWSVEFALQQRGPGYPSMVSFGVSVPLQWDRGHRQDREASARLSEAAQAEAEREEAQREVRAEVLSQMAEWQAGRSRVARYRQEVLPTTDERTQAILAAYRGGKASLAELLAARRAESEQRLQALQIERDNARVWAQLTYIAPVPLTERNGAGVTRQENP